MLCRSLQKELRQLPAEICNPSCNQKLTMKHDKGQLERRDEAVILKAKAVRPVRTQFSL